MVFDQPFASACVWQDKTVQEKTLERQGDHVGARVRFDAETPGLRVHVRVASSFISPEQAERNLKELGDDDLRRTVKIGRGAWNAELGRIAVEGGR
jgi:putative alpha-1,2-mannosidase